MNKGNKKILEKKILSGEPYVLPDNILYNIVEKKFVLANRYKSKPGEVVEFGIIKHTFETIKNRFRKALDEGGNQRVLAYNRGPDGKFRNYITITRENYDNFAQYQEGNNYDSYSQGITTVLDVGDYEIMDVKPKGKKRPQGAFFPYLSKIELPRQGIFSKFDKNNYTKNCLVLAFENSGKFSESEIFSLMEYCRSGYIPKIALRKISEITKTQIHLYTSHDMKIVNYTPDEYEREIHIGLTEGHYYLIERTECTGYAIRNYNKICDIEDWNKIVGTRNDGKYYSKRKNKYLTTYQVINLLVKHKDELLRPINRSAGNIIYNHKDEDIVKAYPVNEHNSRLVMYKDVDKMLFFDEFVDRSSTDDLKYMAFFDIEAYPVGEHEAYMVGCSVGRYTRTFSGDKCIKQFLNWLNVREDIEETAIFAHNLRYDIGFILAEKGVKVEGGPIKSGTSIKVIRLRFFNGPLLTFKDSKSFVNEPLSKFGDMFGLDVEKDVMPYNVYSRKNREKVWIPMEECLKDKALVGKSEQFIKNCKKEHTFRLYKDGKVDIMEYARCYCKKDIEVLKDGMTVFRKHILELSGGTIDFINQVSISQISNALMRNYGCFDDVYEFSGSIQRFFRKCVKGGRCMLRNNEKQYVEELIDDFDGNSLYPSAFFMGPGFEMGKPYVLKPEERNKKFLDTCDNYYLRIDITKVKKPRQFPLISKYEDDCRNYVNEEIKNYYATKAEFEDLIEFQDIEYVIRDGYYFNNGFNTDINKLTYKLYTLRKIFKNEGNPIQQTIKLLMNSMYGKLIMKPIDVKYQFVYGRDNFEKTLTYKHNQIHEVEKLSKDVYLFKNTASVVQSFRCSNLGSSILAMSKRIMNQVMCLAEDLGLDMYYTDTDSIHIKHDHVPILQKAFREKYNKELIGGGLCQFESDFKKINGKISYSTKFIGLGKKSYIDHLENEDGDKEIHARLKGVPTDCMKHKDCVEKYGSVEQQYEDMYKGKEISYNMNHRTCNFDMGGFGPIKNASVICRRIKF